MKIDKILPIVLLALVLSSFSDCGPQVETDFAVANNSSTSIHILMHWSEEDSVFIEESILSSGYEMYIQEFRDEDCNDNTKTGHFNNLFDIRVWTDGKYKVLDSIKIENDVGQFSVKDFSDESNWNYEDRHDCAATLTIEIDNSDF